jgi:hypothetical protein
MPRSAKSRMPTPSPPPSSLRARLVTGDSPASEVASRCCSALAARPSTVPLSRFFGFSTAFAAVPLAAAPPVVSAGAVVVGSVPDDPDELEEPSSPPPPELPTSAGPPPGSVAGTGGSVGVSGPPTVGVLGAY